MRAIPAMLISILAITAGCIGADEPVDTAAADVPDAGGATATAPDATAGATTSDSVDPAEPTIVERIIPVEWSTKLPTSACVPAGPNSCTGQRVAEGENSRVIEVAGEVSGTFELNWASSSPADEEMDFIIIDAEVTSGGWSGTGIASTSGTSPLSLTFDATTLEPGHSLVIYVRPARVTPDPVYGEAQMGTAFEVKGAITERVVSS